MPDMIFIFVLALILFGPKKLPEILRQVGKFVGEFKRASNDFKYQLQSEVEKLDVSTQPAAPAAGGQQTTSFAQTLLPPAVTSAVSEMDSAHKRLMDTARMAFDAQNFSLRPPDAPIVASTEAEPVAAPAVYPPETGAPELRNGPVAIPAQHEGPTPVESVTDHPTPDSAPISNSAQQSS